MDIQIENAPLSGCIRAISSKSDVHRFLIAAALSDGCSCIRFTTLSDDIKATANALCALCANISFHSETEGFRAEVKGNLKKNGAPALFAGECGTTARLLLPVAAALYDAYTLDGAPGLRRRPLEPLCEAMRAGGAEVSGNFLPISCRGRLKSGVYEIRGDVSSQYISGLLFALPLLTGDSEIRLITPLVSAGYVDMTLKTLRRFGIQIKKNTWGYRVPGGQRFHAVPDYTAEGDWSNALFWLCAGALGGKVTVTGLLPDSLQRDKNAVAVLAEAGSAIKWFGDKITVAAAPLRAVSFNGEDMPDALPALAAALTTADGVSQIRGGARLKIKESDRLHTTAEMIRALGGSIECQPDGFIIRGSTLCGGICDAANDHRIAMSAAILATKTAGGAVVCGAEAVAKSYPSFFEDFQKLGGKCHVLTNGQTHNR